MILFFSSRRRHTILVSDWSSDVCSSDLEKGNDNRSVPVLYRDDAIEQHHDHEEEDSEREIVQERIGYHSPFLLRPDASSPTHRRSEERRVGKECRSREWADHERKSKTIE